jgi:hypothetical protein
LQFFEKQSRRKWTLFFNTTTFTPTIVIWFSFVTSWLSRVIPFNSIDRQVYSICFYRISLIDFFNRFYIVLFF